ncbi:MAG: hypothetical protein AB1898_03195 [Acidobacteriota bacterium]
MKSALRVLKAGVLYFLLVFGAGFVLGPIRVLWLVPRVGTRIAELLEAPVMLAVIVLAARWVVRRLSVPPRFSSRMGVGCLALGLILAAELALVLRLRGLSIEEYLATRDPVAAAAYYLLLALCALMPWLVDRK